MTSRMAPAQTIGQCVIYNSYLTARQEGGTPKKVSAFPSMTSMPLTWEPVGLEGLLPRLDADIELGALGEDRTQLAVSARYRPPLGAVGRTVDRVLLHRVAEATVKDFLDRLGHAIRLSQTGPAGRIGP